LQQTALAVSPLVAVRALALEGHESLVQAGVSQD
jgi:hypothetical protein